MIKKNRKRQLYLRLTTAALLIIIVVVCAFTFRPKITLDGGEEITVQVFEPYIEAGASASFFGRDISDSIKYAGKVDTNVPGDYEITYTATHHHRSSSVSRIIHVVDTRKPEITLTGSNDMVLSSMDFFEEPGFTASDNYDGDMTASVQVTQEENKEDNTGTITYTVTDSSGNTAVTTRHIEIRDIVPPVLTLNGKESITLANGAEYVEQGVFAEDDLDGDISSSVAIDGKIDTSKSGDQVVTYTSTDAAGNTSTISRTIHVLNPGEKNPNAIYLTFDDGPSSEVTPKVLKILKKYNIKATFFILNYKDENKKLIQQMIDDGHTIGIHGYSHDYEKIYQSVDDFMENITKLDKKLQDDFDYKPFVIRFPGGSSNTISRNYCKGIMTKLAKKVSDAGYDYLDWNVDSEDATGNNVAKKKLIANVTGGLKENRDNVVLMHDTNAKMTTAKALKKIIKYAKANGYEFYAFTEGTQAVHHGINN